MSEPKGSSPIGPIAAVVFVALVVGGLVLQSLPGKPAPPAPAPAPAVAPAVPQLPRQLPPLDRAALLNAAAAAASAYAAGEEGSAANAALVGRRFTLRLPFGCNGPALDGSGAPDRWEYDAASSTLRLRVEQQVWTDEPWIEAAIGNEDAEAVEGFWIERPWLRTDGCPPYRSPFETSGLLDPQRQTLALAEVFDAGESRVLRRDGRPYEAVRKVEASEIGDGRSFRLVVEGQLVALPSGQPIACHSGNADRAPRCVISAALDRVALENIATGTVYAEWR